MSNRAWFVTIAVEDGYLQRAVAFALSAERFGYPTVLLHRDSDPQPFAGLFERLVDLGELHRKRTSRRTEITALKQYVYEAAPRFDQCAFCDADSLVVRDPSAMFSMFEPVHAPGGKIASGDMRWCVPKGYTTESFARELGIEHPVHTLNGGFLMWRRGKVAEKWFQTFKDLIRRLQDRFFRLGVDRHVDELCMALAFADMKMTLPRSDTSIGVWDAVDLKLDIERQVFECVKNYYWEGHRFRPYIAHFGSNKISHNRVLRIIAADGDALQSALRLHSVPGLCMLVLRAITKV